MPGDRRKAFRVAGFVIAALLVLLAGCEHRYPPPAIVSFPDDPRVLHGDWDLRVTGLWDEVTDFVVTSGAERLILWIDSMAQAFEADGAGGWTSVDAGIFDGLGSQDYDATIPAFVMPRLDGPALHLRVIPLDGSPAVETTVTLPEGYSREGTAIGSGRSFLLARAATGGRQLFWWDSLTGAFGGQVAIPDMYIMTVSGNGSTISFWELDHATKIGYVHIVATAAPTRVHTLSQGTCSRSGFSESSADGRWFVFEDCRDYLHLADLTTPEAGSRATGIKRESGVRFAIDSPELLWMDSAGQISSYHVESEAREVLLQLTGQERLGKVEARSLKPHLERAEDLLAVVSGRRFLRLQRLSSPVETVELPALDFTRASLDLTASARVGSMATAEAYDVSGTFEVAGETLVAEGSVSSDRLHEYRPAASVDIGFVIPPSLRGSLAFSDPLSDEEVMSLAFESHDRNATTYQGYLKRFAAGPAYTIELERSARP
jgi:hypothetical protein